MLFTTIPVNRLGSRFARLWTEVGAQGDARAAFERLVSRYGEPHRGHHGLLHICEMLGLLDWAVRSTPEGPTLPRLELETAVWWHDAVYDPTSETNEHDSALLLRSDTSAPAAFLDSAQALVESTKIGAEHSSPAEQVLHDIDYWILGSPLARYEVYARGIAFEYLPHTDRETYVTKRSAFLESQLDAPTVFYGTRFRLDLGVDVLAKTNIRWELAQLRIPEYVSSLGASLV